MARKRSLPLVSARVGPRPAQASPEDAARPTLERARRRLGGRASTDGTAGRLVRFVGEDAVGVVLYGADTECDVLVDDGVVRRTKPELVHDAPEDSRLARVAAEVRVFARLVEGARVRFAAGGAEAGRTEEGVLAEKCRYGALVAKDDGTLLAVGFRRLWPTENAEA